MRTEGEVALGLLARVRSEGPPGRVVVADDGYGVSGPFRQGLARRGPHYTVGVTDEMVAFEGPPPWIAPGPCRSGRPRSRHRLAEGSPRPVRLKTPGASAQPRKVTWREGAKGELSGRFAWLRVWPGSGWATGDCAGAEPVWLLAEGLAGGTVEYALSNLPEATRRIRAVRPWKGRWPVEQGDQRMKEELGRDHHGGTVVAGTTTTPAR